MATDMERRACDDHDALVYRCGGCGGVLEPCGDDESSLVIFDCFHALHAGCAHGRDACPRCHTPRRVHDDDDDQPEPVDELATAASPPDNNPDENSALASDGVVGTGNNASRLGCCARRVAELESRLEEESAALTETTTVLEMELQRAQNRLCRLEVMYGELKEEFIRLRDGKRAREIEDAEERKKPRNGGRSVSSLPQDQTDD